MELSSWTFPLVIFQLRIRLKAKNLEANFLNKLLRSIKRIQEKQTWNITKKTTKNFLRPITLHKIPICYQSSWFKGGANFIETRLKVNSVLDREPKNYSYIKLFKPFKRCRTCPILSCFHQSYSNFNWIKK